MLFQKITSALAALLLAVASFTAVVTVPPASGQQIAAAAVPVLA